MKRSFEVDFLILSLCLIFCTFLISFIRSYDIEKQEVIELPSQTDFLTFNDMDENHRSTPPPLINKGDTSQEIDAPETTPHQLDVRFDVRSDQNLDQNDK